MPLQINTKLSSTFCQHSIQVHTKQTQVVSMKRVGDIVSKSLVRRRCLVDTNVMMDSLNFPVRLLYILMKHNMSNKYNTLREHVQVLNLQRRGILHVTSCAVKTYCTYTTLLNFTSLNTKVRIKNIDIKIAISVRRPFHNAVKNILVCRYIVPYDKQQNKIVVL